MGAMPLVIGLFVVAAISAWLGSREMDRIFRHAGEYSGGPRPYPDQDPLPRLATRRHSVGDLTYLVDDMRGDCLSRH